MQEILLLFSSRFVQPSYILLCNVDLLDLSSSSVLSKFKIIWCEVEIYVRAVSKII